MYVELIIEPGAEVWYGLAEVEFEEPEVEYEEPEFRRRRTIRKSDFKSRQ